MNTPVQAIDPDGRDVFIVIWYSKTDDGTGESAIGHAALVVENYKQAMVNVLDAKGKVIGQTPKIDGTGKPVMEKDGTYTYVDLWPEAQLGDLELQTGVTADYNERIFKDKTAFTTKDPSASKEKTSSGDQKVSYSGEGIAPDAVIKITTGGYEDDNKVIQKARSIIKSNAQYNACKNNCTSFVTNSLNAILPTLSGQENVDVPKSLEIWPFNYKDTKAHTPNQLYRDATKLPNASFEKKPAAAPETKPYLEIVK